jgi:hypothetical protein
MMLRMDERAIDDAASFSTRLERWLQSDQPKTLGTLDHVFAEDSFAVAILLLMVVPALPLPTGGISHVLEAASIVLGAEMVAGRRTIWLPRRWRDRPLGGAVTGKAIPKVAGWMRRVERISRPRGSWLFRRGWFHRLLGLVLIVFVVAAALAPPFSGLDTFPALGAVLICLAIILDDALVLGIGVAIGVGGIVLIVTVGATLFHLFERLL